MHTENFSVKIVNCCITQVENYIEIGPGIIASVIVYAWTENIFWDCNVPLFVDNFVDAGRRAACTLL